MDLSNANNWSSIFSSQRQASVLTQYADGSPRSYNPLDPLVVGLATPVGIVRTQVQNLRHRPDWVSCCWMEVYLYFAGARNLVQKRGFKPNRSTFFQLIDFKIYPYELKFIFPYWLGDISLEVFQFTSQSGQYLSADEQVILSAVEVVEMRQAELEQIIKQTQQQGT